MFLSKIRFIKYLSLSFLIFIVDQISKVLIKNKFSFYEYGWKTSENLDEISIIDPFLIFKRIDNSGIAFGFDSNGDFSYIITPLTIILTIFIAIYLYKVSSKKNTLLSLSLAFILGGALGNLFDRLYSNAVVDFIWIGLTHNIRWDYIFNLADTFITIGMTMLIVSDLIIRKKKKNERKKNKIAQR